MPFQLRNGQPIADAWGINIVEGTGVTVTGTYDTSEQRVDWTFAATAAIASARQLPNDRTVTDATFSGPPGVGTLAAITYASTVHAYNLALRVGTGVWIHLRRGTHGRDGGAFFDKNADDAAAIQSVMNETTGGSWGTSMQGLWLPAGQALVGTTLVPYTGGGAIIRGEGNNASALVLADTLDGAVISTRALGGARRFFRDFRVTARQKYGHASTFPLLDFSGDDVGSYSLLAVDNSPGGGILHSGYVNGNPAGQATSDGRWWFPWLASNTTYGMLLDEMSKHLISGGLFANTTMGPGLWLRGHSNRAWSQASAHGISTELNVYGARLERCSNNHYFDIYSDNEGGGIVTDDAYRNVVENVLLIGNQLPAAVTKHKGCFYNADHWTVERNMHGKLSPFDDAIGYHLPGSVVLDPYESFLDASAWKTAGTGAVTKGYSLDGIRFQRTFGRHPVRISVGTVAVGNYAYKEIICAAGDSIDLYDYWWAAALSGVIIRIADDAAPTVDLYNSGALTHRSGTASDWGEERHFHSFRVPTGVTKLRLIYQPTGAGTGNAVYVGRNDDIYSKTVVNPGMQSVTGFAYAAGIASGWAALSGAGTASEETTIKKFPGSSSQKIVCTAGQAKYVSQTVTLDPRRFYELRGWVYVPSAAVRTVSDGVTTSGSVTLTSATAAFVSTDVGRIVSGTAFAPGTAISSVTNGTTVVLSIAAGATGSGQTVNLGACQQHAVIGVGNDLTADYSIRLPAFSADEWTPITEIIKPDSSHTKLIFGMMAQGTAYFQYVSLTPLRDRGEGAWQHTTPIELDLAGATTSFYLKIPTIDEVVHRATVTFTAATGAGSGTVNIGVLGDLTRFGTVTGVRAAGEQVNVTFTRSDLRAINPGTSGSLPLVVSTPGGGTAGYKAIVTVEGGGTL
jgi:hypothetical protein